jgi:hypothetical protein
MHVIQDIWEGILINPGVDPNNNENMLIELSVVDTLHKTKWVSVQFASAFILYSKAFV